MSKYCILENIDFLKDWLIEAENFARNIGDRARKKGGEAIFTISTTLKVPQEGRPYFTPVRDINNDFIGGSVVFSQTQAILLCERIDGMVDRILVDAEKKIEFNLCKTDDILMYFGVEPPPSKHHSRVDVELGNLSGACLNHIKKSDFHEFKPNDMTVEAVWHFLSSRYRILSGKKIAIIGAGNIGFKLALKLVESGSHVELVRRDLSRGMLMSNLINVVKPKSTLAIAHYNSDPLQASLFGDVLIGCTDGIPVITWDMIQTMKPDGIVLDVGKGCVFEDAIQKSVNAGIPVVRCDITSAIHGFVSTMQKNQMIVAREMGRQEVEKSIFVVSGGYMGLADDIVVDNYRDPHKIIGIANGMGDFKAHLTEDDHERLSIVRARIKHAKDQSID